MRQYILILAYDGTRFSGFQRQHSSTEPTKIDGINKRPRIDPTTGQRQPLLTLDKTKRNVTIQECLEYAILHWLDGNHGNDNDNVNQTTSWSLEQLNLRVAGRTDKGVHARGQVVAIQLPASIEPIEPWAIQKGIHGRLPDDISIRAVIPVTTTIPTTNTPFDPRRNAQHKQYSYTIKFQRRQQQQQPKWNGSTTVKNDDNNNNKGVGPTYFRMALEDSPCLWLCHHALDVPLMQQACQRLQGTHDYSAFVHKQARDDKDNTLTVTRFELEILKEYKPPSLYYAEPDPQQQPQQDDHPDIVLARFYVEGKRFRRTMVRNLVGFVVEVGRGYQPLDCIDSLWTGSKEAAARIPAAPASGLCLEFVKF